VVVAKSKSAATLVPKPTKSVMPGKLSYKEQRELAQLPARIETLEQRQQELQTLSADPAFYKQEATVVTQRLDELRAVETELEAAYERWAALEG